MPCCTALCWRPRSSSSGRGNILRAVADATGGGGAGIGSRGGSAGGGGAGSGGNIDLGDDDIPFPEPLNPKALKKVRVPAGHLQRVPSRRLALLCAPLRAFDRQATTTLAQRCSRCAPAGTRSLHCPMQDAAPAGITKESLLTVQQVLGAGCALAATVGSPVFWLSAKLAALDEKHDSLGKDQRRTKEVRRTTKEVRRSAKALRKELRRTTRALRLEMGQDLQALSVQLRQQNWMLCALSVLLSPWSGKAAAQIMKKFSA